MLTAPTQIHLIRHGEVHNPRQILYGRLPRFRLSDAGRRQAESTAHWFNGRPVAALFSSPLLRARQTAQAFADRHPLLQIQISAWLNEVYTSYEGWPGATIDARGGDVYTGSGDGFEQPDDIVKRVRKFTARSCARFPGRQVVAITHGDVITFTYLWALGFDLTPENKTRLKQAGFAVAYPAHASVTTLTCQTNAPNERPKITYHNPGMFDQ
jgi:broad specificity phosphatase PhoE